MSKKVLTISFVFSLFLVVGIQRSSMAQSNQTFIEFPCMNNFDDDEHLRVLGVEHAQSESEAIEYAKHRAKTMLMERVMYSMYSLLGDYFDSAVEQGDWVCTESRKRPDGSYDAYVALEVQREVLKINMEAAIEEYSKFLGFAKKKMEELPNNQKLNK